MNHYTKMTYATLQNQCMCWRKTAKRTIMNPELRKTDNFQLSQHLEKTSEYWQLKIIKVRHTKVQNAHACYIQWQARID